MAPVGQFLLVFFIFVHTVVSGETDLNEFFVVSTSQRPSEVQSVADRLKLEFKLLEKLTIDKLEMMLKDHLKRFHKEIENNSIKLVDLKKSLGQQLEDARKEIKELKDSKVSMEVESEEIKKELRISKESLEKQLEETKREISELKNSKDTLQEQVEKAEREISELKNSKVSFETQIQRRINESQHESYETKIKIEELTSNTQLQAKQLQEQSDHLGKNFKELQNIQKLIEYNLPKDCKEVRKTGFSSSGVYRIKPEPSVDSFKVWCDMETRDGAWIYFLNRFDGSVDFHLNWTDYKQGFGNPSGELWLGLENLYQLTGSQAKELLIELVDWDMKKIYAHYTKFSIGNEEEGYFLKMLNGYSGDAGACFTGHLGQKFSTEDQDQDEWTGNCAESWEGGWWFQACTWSFFTGKYNDESCVSTVDRRGIKCDSYHESTYNHKEVRMMIR